MKKIIFYFLLIFIFYVKFSYTDSFSKRIISDPKYLADYFNDELFISVTSTNLNIRGKIYSKNQSKFIFFNFLKKYKFLNVLSDKIIDGDNKIENIKIEGIDLKRNKKCKISMQIFFIGDKEYIINKLIILQGV